MDHVSVADGVDQHWRALHAACKRSVEEVRGKLHRARRRRAVMPGVRQGAGMGAAFILGMGGGAMLYDLYVDLQGRAPAMRIGASTLIRPAGEAGASTRAGA